MEKKNRSSYFSAGITAFAVIAGGLLVLFALLRFDVIAGFFKQLAGILRPFTIGIVLAFLLYPIYRGVINLLTIIAHGAEKKKGIKSLIRFGAVFISLAVGLLVCYFILAMMLPQLYMSIVRFVQSLPNLFTDIQTWLQEFLKNHPDIEAAVLPIYEDVATEFQNWMQSKFIPNLESVSSTLAYLEKTFLPSLGSFANNVSVAIRGLYTFFKDIFIGIIVCVYLLLRKDVFLAQLKKITYGILPRKYADVLTEECNTAYHILSGFIFGKVVDSIIIGAICLICCNLMRMPYPSLIATIVGITNIIPFFGPLIGAVPCFLLILLVNPLKSLYFLIFIIILQQFDGNILGPKILGNTTGIDAFWVLFSILLFGGLFGFTGMVLGVPVFATIYGIIGRLIKRQLKKRGLPADTGSYADKGPIPKIDSAPPKPAE